MINAEIIESTVKEIFNEYNATNKLKYSLCDDIRLVCTYMQWDNKKMLRDFIVDIILVEVSMMDDKNYESYYTNSCKNYQLNKLYDAVTNIMTENSSNYKDLIQSRCIYLLNSTKDSSEEINYDLLSIMVANRVTYDIVLNEIHSKGIYGVSSTTSIPYQIVSIMGRMIN